MTPEHYKHLETVAEIARENFRLPEEIHREIEYTKRAICALEAPANILETPNYELRIELREIPSGWVSPIHEVDRATWSKRRTKPSRFILPALKAYLAELEKEFAAL